MSFSNRIGDRVPPDKFLYIMRTSFFSSRPPSPKSICRASKKYSAFSTGGDLGLWGAECECECKGPYALQAVAHVLYHHIITFTTTYLPQLGENPDEMREVQVVSPRLLHLVVERHRREWAVRQLGHVHESGL